MSKDIDEKILQANELLQQNKNRLKVLQQQKKSEERKSRTRRLIERGALVESFVPNAEAMDNEQFKAVLTKVFLQ